MPRATLDSIHAIEFQLHSWRPFKTLDSSDSPKPYPTTHGPHSKRPCRSDRATSSFSIDASILDMSKLSLFDDDKTLFSFSHKRWFARKRRRRAGSRSVSVSGRSSDRRCCASAANGTCSDFPMAAGGTDSSGEMFGEANWASDVSERNSRREKEGNAGGGGDRDHVSNGCGQFGGNCESQGNESGYGSEPGYRGDAEFGYGDEVDEEEDDPRALFWGEGFGGDASKLEGVGENSLQKAHHRGRRKKHDLRMVDSVR